MRLLLTLLTSFVLSAQPATLEIQGTVVKTLVGRPGEGCRLMVATAEGREWAVRLGPFRYLMAQDFRPKAGQLVTVRGMARAMGQGPDELVAQSVTLQASGRTLELRDAAGRPLWRGAARPDPPQP